MISEHALSVDHVGEKVFVEVSPCSWMHPGYGLQICLSIKPRGPNAECTFVNHKQYDGMKMTRPEMDAIALVLAGEWLAANGTAPLHAKIAEWAAAKAASDVEIAKIDEHEQVIRTRLDKKRKREGYTHRVDAWIHPSQGDDYQTGAYVRGQPDATMISKLLRNCVVKTDYSVTAI